MGKVILFKTPGSLPHLQVAVAVNADSDSGMIILKEPVTLNGDLTLAVPASMCYEFDGDLMDKVNTLTTRATEAAIAAQMLVEEHAKLADVGDDVTSHVVFH